MSILTCAWVRVDSLHTGHHIVYDGRDWTVMEVLPVELPGDRNGGFGVIAAAVADRRNPPLRTVLLYANRAAVAQLVGRAVTR